MELFKTDIIPNRTISEIFKQELGTGFKYEQTSMSGQTILSPRIIGGTLEGMTFRSKDTGARIEMFPVEDANIGMVVYDDANSEIFKILTAGTEVGDIIFGDSATNYLKWDKSAGTLLLNGMTATNTILSSIASGSEIAIQGWQHDMTFSSTDHDTVAWTSGTITLLDETTYSITGANTGAMSAITYIYLDIATSTTALQTTTTASTAVGTGKIIIAVAQNVASGKKATFQVFGGMALGGTGKLTTYQDIAANTITANEMNINILSAITANMGSLTSGNITIDSSGYIRGGQTAYNTGVGWWIGYDSTAYKLSIGDPSNYKYMKFDGTNLISTGLAIKEKIVSGEQTTAGNVVCIKKRVYDYKGTDGFTDDSYTDSSIPDANYGSDTDMVLGYSRHHAFLKHINRGGPVEKAVIRIYGDVRGTVPREVSLSRVSSADWAEGTITYNNQPTTIGGEGVKSTTVTATGYQWIDFDITQFYRRVYAGVESNNWGVKLSAGSGGAGISSIRSCQYADINYRPKLRITFSNLYELNGGALAAYKADDSDINTSTRIKGIVTSGAAAGSNSIVQTFGVVSGLSALTAGAEYFVGTSGGLKTKISANADFDSIYTKVGDAISATELMLNIEPETWLDTVEDISTISSGAGSPQYVMCPVDANMAIIHFQIAATGGAGDPHRKGTITLVRNGINTVVMDNKNGSTDYTVTYAWESTYNKIVITDTSLPANIYSLTTIVFYK